MKVVNHCAQSQRQWQFKNPQQELSTAREREDVRQREREREHEWEHSRQRAKERIGEKRGEYQKQYKAWSQKERPIRVNFTVPALVCVCVSVRVYLTVCVCVFSFWFAAVVFVVVVVAHVKNSKRNGLVACGTRKRALSEGGGGRCRWGARLVGACRLHFGAACAQVSVWVCICVCLWLDVRILLEASLLLCLTLWPRRGDALSSILSVIHTHTHTRAWEYLQHLLVNEF